MARSCRRVSPTCRVRYPMNFLCRPGHGSSDAPLLRIMCGLRPLHPAQYRRDAGRSQDRFDCSHQCAVEETVTLRVVNCRRIKNHAPRGAPGRDSGVVGGDIVMIVYLATTTRLKRCDCLVYCPQVQSGNRVHHLRRRNCRAPEQARRIRAAVNGSYPAGTWGEW